MPSLAAISDIFGLLSNVSVALGIPIFAYQYMKERREREYGTFDALDEKYVEFQRLCIDYPELDIHDVPLAPGAAPNAETLRGKQEEAALWILIALFERAFLMYRRHPRKVRRNQFEGWVQQMREWAKRDNFRRAWGLLAPGDYDRDFMDWFERDILALVVEKSEVATG